MAHATMYTPAVVEAVQHAVDQYSNGYCTLTEMVGMCLEHNVVVVSAANTKEFEMVIDTGRVLCDLAGFPELEHRDFHASVELA